MARKKGEEKPAKRKTSNFREIVRHQEPARVLRPFASIILHHFLIWICDHFLDIAPSQLFQVSHAASRDGTESWLFHSHSDQDGQDTHSSVWCGREVHRSFVSAASKQKQLDVVESDMKKLSNAIENDTKFRDFLYNPLANLAQKQDILQQTLKGKLGSSELTVNLVNVMTQGRRLKF